MHKRGQNFSVNDAAVVTTFTLDPVIPKIISIANKERFYFYVCLAPGELDVVGAIRLYEAGRDTIAHGIILLRCTFGNDSLLKNDWEMPTDSLYTGEISAIGTGDIFVTEY